MIGNVVTKKYMSDNEKFADLFNYVLHNGKPIIRADKLIDCDPNELMVSEGENKEIIVKDKMRDIKKSWILKKDDNVAYLMLGIENQTDIHYAMPVRNMFYDVLEYERQIREHKKMHRKIGDLKGKEFISGFSKTDKFIPVITLVIYFGADIWDGPRTLHEMFDIQNRDILEYVSDYKLNLIEPIAIEDTHKFHSDFKYVVDFIKILKIK